MKVSFSKSGNEIIAGIRNGNSKMMEDLYLEYRNEFISWSIQKFSISEDDALDHYQDVMTIFYEKVMSERITEVSSTIKTYVFGIGKNRVRQQFDELTRKERHENGLTEYYQFLAAEEESNELYNASRNGVNRIFDSIGEACKKILRLFYFEKRSMNEIAEILGHKSEGVSRTTKKRCLEKIRSELKSFNNG